MFGQAWVAPELSQLLDDFVTKGVDAWAGSQGVPSQGMQALDAGRHAAGRDPIDLGDGVQTGLLTNPSAVGKVGLVGASVLLGESLVLTKSFGHPGHQSGGLEGADEGGCTGAGQVVGRREGSAIRQPGLGRNAWRSSSVNSSSMVTSSMGGARGGRLHRGSRCDHRSRGGGGRCGMVNVLDRFGGLPPPVDISAGLGRGVLLVQ